MKFFFFKSSQIQNWITVAQTFDRSADTRAILSLRTSDFFVVEFAWRGSL